MGEGVGGFIKGEEGGGLEKAEEGGLGIEGGRLVEVVGGAGFAVGGSL